MHPDARLLPLCRRPHHPPMQHKNFNIIAALATNSIAFIHAWRRRYRITNPCTPMPSFGYGSSPSVSTEYILSFMHSVDTESQNPHTPTFGYGSSPLSVD